MKKNTIIAYCIGVGVLLITVFFFPFPQLDKDCELAVRRVVSQLGQETFTSLDNEIGRCDGLCVDWSPIGCTISDDKDSWFVSPWGSVRKK